MTNPKPTNPNYTEDEVWNMLTAYLVNKHLAAENSIQRGVYADFQKEGTRFEVSQCKDEHAILYCYRNLNFNISGNIIYPIEDEYSEEFTLESICEFTGNPFPKEHTIVDLTPEESTMKENNIIIAKEYQNNKALRNKHKSKVKKTLNALIQAFEYERASQCANRAFHLNQHTKEPKKTRFVTSNKLNFHNKALALCASIPTEEDFISFIQRQTAVFEYNGVNKEEVISKAPKAYAITYKTLFPQEIRKAGCLLYPMEDHQGNIISAVSIIDIPKRDNANEFIIAEANQACIGTIKFDQNTTLGEVIIIVESIEIADILKTILPEITIHAAITAKNLAKQAIKISEANPHAQVLTLLNNDYSAVRKNKSWMSFNNCPTQIIATALSKNEPENLGVITLNHELIEEIGGLKQLYALSPIEDTQLAIKETLDRYYERRLTGHSEVTHLIETHDMFSTYFKDEYKLTPKPIIIDEPEEPNPTLPHPMIYEVNVNSVLFQEGQADLKKWFAVRPPEHMLKEEQVWSDKAVSFAQHAPSISEDEMDEMAKHPYQGGQFGEGII